MSTVKIGIFGFFLLITLASGSKCPQEDVTKSVICYYESETSLSNFNICSCTHVVFINGVKKGENNRLSLDEGIQRNLDLIKKKKDGMFALFTLDIKSVDVSAKSENRSDELIFGVADLLQKSKFNGVELNFKFSSENGVSKESYGSFVKKLSKTLSSAHRRVKRDGYDVFEKVQDDVTTVAYTTQTPKNSTSRTQSISRREKTKKSRNTREDRVTAVQSDQITLEAAINKEFSSEKSSESHTDKDVEMEENKFLVFLRLPIEPEIIAKKFDLKLLGRYADMLLVSTHDIVNKNEDHLTYHPSRLMGLSDMYNTDSVLDFLTGMAAPKSKIAIIIPTTVLKFQLKNATENTPRSPSISKPEVINQSQFCSLLRKNKNWTIERDDDLTAPYAYSGKTWLAFEDETSIDIKGKYILLRELAGGALYPIDADTNDGSCGNRTRSGFLAEVLHKNFQNLGRKPRALILENLQEEVHSRGFTSIEAGVKHSEYRIVRIVDHSGAVHVIRRNTKTQFECSRQGYFSHPLGCNKFYRCVKFDQYSDEFTVFEYDCPAGLAFDERWEVCVWPGSLPHGAPCKGSSEIAPVPKSHYRCPNQEGYYADPENCRWFFACMDHVRDGVTPLTAYEFRCPFGLVFNEERLACDWPWLVNACGNRGTAGFLKTHTEFVNGGNLAASSGQYGSLEQEATFHGFGRGFGSGLGYHGRGQSAGFGYIGSGLDDNQNRVPFGSFPDYEISGGRIRNEEGVVLGQLIAGLGGSSGNSDVSLHSEGAGSSYVIPGSAGAANEQDSGFLYHRNSHSTYGQGSISVSTPTVNVPVQHQYTGHSTVAANNLLVEYGQKESYRGDASFQDIVTTPKPFSVNIPSVQINQEEAYSGHTTAAANTLLATGFGQKESAREFSKITQEKGGHIFGSSVTSGESVTSPIAFSTTPTTPTPTPFKAVGVTGVLYSKGYSSGNEDVGAISSVTPKPSVKILEHTSSRDHQGGVGTQGVSFQQPISTQPDVSIGSPGLFGTTPILPSSKPIAHGFRYSSEHAGGFSGVISVNQPDQVISNILTPRTEVHNSEKISGGVVKVQGQGDVHVSTPQLTFNTVTSEVPVNRPTVPITGGFSSESGSNVKISGSIIPKLEGPTFGYKFSHGKQGAVSVQAVSFGQSGVPLSTPIPFSTTTQTQDIKPVVVSLSQPATTGGLSFEHSSSDVNFDGSVISNPEVQTSEYISSQSKETAVNGSRIFEQKFNIRPIVPVGTIKPPSSINVVSQPVTHIIGGYSGGDGISEPSTARPDLFSFGHVSSGQINGQGLGKKSSVGAITYRTGGQNLRPIQEIAVDQPALSVSNEYSFQHAGHVEASNTLQPGGGTLELTSTLGKQGSQGTGLGQSVDIQTDVSVVSPVSTTLQPPNFKISHQSIPLVGIGHSFDKQSEYSSRVNGPNHVISSTFKPVAGFGQTSTLNIDKQGGGKEFSFKVSTPELPNFKPFGDSTSQTISGYSAGHFTATTPSQPQFFEHISERGQPSTVGEQSVTFGQLPTVQPVSVNIPVTFSTTQKPETLGVSVSQPVSGFSVPHVTLQSGVSTFESSQSFNTQSVKNNQPLTPTGGVYESGFRVSGPKSLFEETNFSKEKQNAVPISSGQLVTPAVQVLKNTGSSFYSYEQPSVTSNPFQQNLDAKVFNEVNLNKNLAYGVPIKSSESGLFDGAFGAKTPITVKSITEEPAISPTVIPVGQQFSYASFNSGGFTSSKKISSIPKQQEILTELSIEQQPVVSIGTINSFNYNQRASTPEPNILKQGVVPPKTGIDYQQQIFDENVKPPTPTVVPVIESKPYLLSVKPKTDNFRPAVVPFESVGREQKQENFEFLKTPVNEFKAREELAGLDITKSVEVNPNQFYRPTATPTVIQQQPVHLLSQKTYSFDVIQPFGKGKVQIGNQAPVSSTSSPIGYGSRTTDDGRVILRGDDGVAPGLYQPNVQIKIDSPTVSQNVQPHITEPLQHVRPLEEDTFIPTYKTFDSQKVKSPQKIYLKPQSVFGSQNITAFPLNPKIEIPDPPQEYLAQYTTSQPATKSRFKSTTYVPPENDNIQQVLNKYNGRFGQINKEQGSTYEYEASGTTQRPRSRGRQYYGDIVSNQKATNKYEEYDINGQGRPDSRTTINLTNLKLDKDKKTVIVISQVSDANPVLIGKLAGQCSCQSNVIELKTKGKKSAQRKSSQITNQFLPPLETSPSKDASISNTVVIDDKSPTTPQPASSTILSSLSPDGVLTITSKSVYGGSLKKKQFRGRARYLSPSEDLLSAVPASEIASTVDYASARNEIDGRGAGAAFDRYGPGGWRGFDETLQGSVDCKRPGLFRHPKYCNKFYSCNYDPWKERYVLHVFNCPIHLAYDSSISACNWPVRGPACADDNLLV